MTNYTTPTSPAVELEYRAVGWVRGQYFPSQKTFNQGILLTDDGLTTTTDILGIAAYYLQKHLELLESPQIWTVYPRTRLHAPYLRFTISGVNPAPTEEEVSPNSLSVDYFYVWGLVAEQDTQAGKLAIRIGRNVEPPKGQEKAPKYKSHLLRMEGVLPERAKGQFWKLDVRREKDKLVLADAKFVAQIVQPKQPQKIQKQRRSGATGNHRRSAPSF